MASDSIEQERLENSIPSDNTILFKSKGKGGQALTFDIRDDIKRGQEFLKRQGCRLFAGAGGKENQLLLTRRAGKREKLVREKVMKPNFLLAVEDLKERKIRQVRITDKGCVTEGFEVTKNRNNGVGSNV